MHWFEWVFIALNGLLSASALAAFHSVKKLDQDLGVRSPRADLHSVVIHQLDRDIPIRERHPPSGMKLLSSFLKKVAYRHATNSSATPRMILKIALTVLWLPLMLVLVLLAVVFFGLHDAHLKITGYWDRWKRGRMAPEQKRDYEIEQEKQILARASRMRLNPCLMDSNHPLDSAYREMILTSESLALKMREAREGREMSEGGCRA